MSHCIPFTQSWYSLSAWKMVIATRPVKQIGFHSYLVTVRFSFSSTACNTIFHVPPLASGEIFCLAWLEMDRENSDWLWLEAGLWGAGSSAVCCGGKDEWMHREMRWEKQRSVGSIPRPSESFSWYELNKISLCSLSHKGKFHSTPIT